MFVMTAKVSKTRIAAIFVLLIALCVLGVALDLLVYLLRWKPYRVWNSFFRRRTEKAMPVG